MAIIDNTNSHMLALRHRLSNKKGTIYIARFIFRVSTDTEALAVHVTDSEPAPRGIIFVLSHPDRIPVLHN